MLLEYHRHLVVIQVMSPEESFSENTVEQILKQDIDYRLSSAGECKMKKLLHRIC
jgi:hypothetical protein